MALAYAGAILLKKGIYYMNKEKHKKITFEQIIARKLQRDKDKMAVKEIYIPSMEGTLLFKRIPEDDMLGLLDEIDENGNKRSQNVEASRKLIYMSCPDLQNPELHKELGIIDPFDVVRAIFSIEEANEIGTELLEFNEVAKRTKNAENEIKN